MTITKAKRHEFQPRDPKESLMSTATHPPVDSGHLHDDPELPGTYVTDGERLFRLVGSDEPRRGFVGLEDCATLDIVLVLGEELRGWDLTVITKSPLGGAARCR